MAGDRRLGVPLGPLWRECYEIEASAQAWRVVSRTQSASVRCGYKFVANKRGMAACKCVRGSLARKGHGPYLCCMQLPGQYLCLMSDDRRLVSGAWRYRVGAAKASEGRRDLLHSFQRSFPPNPATVGSNHCNTPCYLAPPANCPLPAQFINTHASVVRSPRPAASLGVTGTSPRMQTCPRSGAVWPTLLVTLAILSCIHQPAAARKTASMSICQVAGCWS